MTTVPAANPLGAKIVAALKRVDQPRAWLAVEIGVHPDTIDRWIKGTTQPSFAQMLSVAAALEQPLAYFTTDGAA